MDTYTVSSCPIDKLVDDVLLIIFHMVITPLDFCRPSNRYCSSAIVLRLMLVCRRWNAVVSSSPYTWSRFSTSSRAVAKAFLERSQPFQVDIFLQYPDKALLDLVLEHSHRFRQFHVLDRRVIAVGPNSDTFDLICTFPAPALQSLTLGLRRLSEDGMALIGVSSKRFPNLTKLRLLDVSIDIRGFTRLTHLCIEVHFVQLSFTNVLSVIQENLALEEIILIHVREDFVPLQTSVVELSRLRRVHLCGLSPLFDYIQPMSPQYSIRLEARIYQSPSFSFTPPILRLGIRCSTSGTFTAVSDYHHIRSSISPYIADGETIVSAFNLILEQAAQDSAFATVQELWLSDCHTPHRIEAWTVLLNSMRSLTKIFIAPGSCSFMLATLTPDRAGHVACPTLQGLYLLYSPINYENLFIMVEQRQKWGFPLRKLCIHSIAQVSEGEVERLRPHVDEVFVVRSTTPFDQSMPRLVIPLQFRQYRHDHWTDLPEWPE